MPLTGFRPASFYRVRLSRSAKSNFINSIGLTAPIASLAPTGKPPINEVEPEASFGSRHQQDWCQQAKRCNGRGCAGNHLSLGFWLGECDFPNFDHLAEFICYSASCRVGRPQRFGDIILRHAKAHLRRRSVPPVEAQPPTTMQTLNIANVFRTIVTAPCRNNPPRW